MSLPLLISLFHSHCPRPAKVRPIILGLSFSAHHPPSLTPLLACVLGLSLTYTLYCRDPSSSARIFKLLFTAQADTAKAVTYILSCSQGLLAHISGWSGAELVFEPICAWLKVLNEIKSEMAVLKWHNTHFSGMEEPGLGRFLYPSLVTFKHMSPLTSASGWELPPR